MDPDAVKPKLSTEVAAYLADSYPRNHNYRVVKGCLRAKWRLASRYRKIRRLYPEPVTSLVDVCCSKGYFVMEAASDARCERALGLDVVDRELAASRAVKACLRLQRASVHRLRLHELAERIDEFGGPFEVALVVNAYQYLYFGSELCAAAYFSHDEIFRALRSICRGRVIFNNRTELGRAQPYCQAAARRHGHEDLYSTERIIKAASKYFTVTRRGRIGKYPLFAMDAGTGW